MYERANPFYEHFLRGHIDMSRCCYEQYDERTVHVTGPRYVPGSQLRVKLEGSGRFGERYVGIVGVRDAYTIARAANGGRTGNNLCRQYAARILHQSSHTGPKGPKGKT